MTDKTGKLSVWMNGPRATALKRTAERWWEQVLAWLQSPHELGDALTAPLAVVDLYAYQRGITRAAIDTERRYRLKVHYALINARDAGTRAGMARIFQRLELPVFDLTERMPGYDWDMIGVDIDARDVETQRPYLMDIWGLYGRTCRRFAIRGHINSRSRLQVAAAGSAMQILHSRGHVQPVSITSRSVLTLGSSGSGLSILRSAGSAA